MSVHDYNVCMCVCVCEENWCQYMTTMCVGVCVRTDVSTWLQCVCVRRTDVSTWLHVCVCVWELMSVHDYNVCRCVCEENWCQYMTTMCVRVCVRTDVSTWLQCVYVCVWGELMSVHDYNVCMCVCEENWCQYMTTMCVRVYMCVCEEESEWVNTHNREDIQEVCVSCDF